MHRRLRRQLEEALGQEESSPHLRKLLRRIDKEYRRADGERASLQHALALLSNLLKRQPDAERPRASRRRGGDVSPPGAPLLRARSDQPLERSEARSCLDLRYGRRFLRF